MFKIKFLHWDKSDVLVATSLTCYSNLNGTCQSWVEVNMGIFCKVLKRTWDHFRPLSGAIICPFQYAFFCPILSASQWKWSSCAIVNLKCFSSATLIRCNRVSDVSAAISAPSLWTNQHVPAVSIDWTIRCHVPVPHTRISRIMSDNYANCLGSSFGLSSFKNCGCLLTRGPRLEDSSVLHFVHTNSFLLNDGKI